MKKIFFALLIIAALALAITYLFIPDRIKITAAARGSANTNAAYRYLIPDENWKKWWPGPAAFNYNNVRFIAGKKFLNRFGMQLIYKQDTIENILELVPISPDSTGYSWSCEIESSKNPIRKWMRYSEAAHLKKTLDVLVDSLKNHLEKGENLYGFAVRKIKVTDSILISTRQIFDHYPNEQEIDVMVQALKNYIKKERAIEKNYPMLNVHQLNGDKFEAMVAIATERELPAIKDFTPKYVLKGGNILEAEFKGGPYSLRNAFREFENYKTDMQFSSPAIPYQLMITDRKSEKDTSQWITKFYYPVF